MEKKRKVTEGVEGANTQSDEVVAKIDAQYTEGNVALLCSTGEGYKVWDYLLKARSNVFRGMFETIPVNDQVIRIPDTTISSLKCFVDSLLEKPHLAPWHTVQGALRLCEVYECPSLARVILSSALDGKVEFTTFSLHRAFIFACKFDDIAAACRIMLLQSSANFSGQLALHLIDSWTRAQVRELSSEWAWAFGQAIQKARSAGLEYGKSPQGNKNFWAYLAVVFSDQLR